MAGNLSLYARLQVYINGDFLAECTNVNVKRVSGNRPQKTLGKDFAGVTPGAKGLNLTLDNAVPSMDFELNPGKFMNTTEVVEVTVYAGQVRHMSFKGFIMDDSLSQSVDAETKLSFTLEGEYADYD